jgi:Kef-type K+ transport system membrane component KefB
LNDLIPTLAIILLAAEAGGLLANLLGQPRVVGQIGAGLILGPTVTSLVVMNGSVDGIAQLGALAILGVAGLETNLVAMRSVGRAAVLAACGGVLVPFVAGSFVAMLAGLSPMAAVFIGAILTATSVGITAATLQELHLMDTRAAMTIIGAAVIDDVLGLIVLGLVISETSSSGNIALTILPIIGTVLVVWAVLRWLPDHLGRGIAHLHGRGGGLAATVGIVLAAAWAIQAFGGLAGITGAYVAGLALARSSVAPQVREGMVRAGEAFCVPVFFVAIGLATDLRTVGPVFPLAVALLVVAVVGKLVGSGVGAAMAGIGARESSLVGIGMIARGEVALVAATIGLRSGAIDGSIYAVIVLVSVGTTIIAPLGIAAWCRFGRPLAWPALEVSGSVQSAAQMIPVEAE